MKLFGHDTSPYVRRVRALLQELDVPFERDTGDWLLKPSDEFLRLSPIGRLPLLLVEREGGQLPIFDSKTIADYLLTHHAPKNGAARKSELPLQPTLFHPAHRYEDENVLTIIDTALDSGIQIFIFERDGIKRDSAPYLRRQDERVAKCLSAVDAIYADRTTLHDGVLGYTDLALASCIDWFRLRKVRELSSYVNLARFLDSHLARPSVASTDPRIGG